MNELSLINLLMLAMMIIIVVLLWRMRGQQSYSDLRNEEQNRQFQNMDKKLSDGRESQLASLAGMQSKFEQRFGEMQQSIEKRLGEMGQSSIEKMAESNKQMQEMLHQRLNEISGQVEKRLNKGFEKTTETFTNVV